MDKHVDNAKWLICFAPFRALSISAAYLTPFFLQKGLSLSEIFLLQSIFSLAVLLWEIPSGYIADRIGRAFSIKISAPVAAAAMIAYGLSGQFWQFIICELVLALAYGLYSGIDKALLYDSLLAQNREDDYTKLLQRMKSAEFASTAVGVPLAIALVYFVSISATLVADGLLTLVGMIFALKLVEAPRSNGSTEAMRLSAWHAVRQLGGNAHARWLIVLFASLNTATYIAAWLSAPYYSDMGIPVVLFSAILAIRSLWKAWLSHKYHQTRRIQRNMMMYAALAGLVYVGMSTGQLWLAWVVLGHDMVQALQEAPIMAQLNSYIEHEYRATINSVFNLVNRLAFMIAGPLVGLVVDRGGLKMGLVSTGLVCSSLAFVAVARLHSMRTFEDKI